MEGGALLGIDNEFNSGANPTIDQSGFDEAASCAHAFGVLKQLIQRCLADAPSVKTSRSSSSPATSQGSIDHAKSLCTVVGRVPQVRCNNCIFKLLKDYYRHGNMILLQPKLTVTYNYGGIPAKSDESQVDIISSWNIAEYLPKKIQTSCDQFIVIVSQFLYIPWSYAQKQAGIRESMLNGDSCTPSINIGAAKALESEMIEYIKEQISSFFTDNLLRILRYIVLHMKRASKSEDDPSTSSGLPQIVGDQHRGDAS
nr:DNA polymerase epsilon catalytic subunit A-like [Arachis hypogaea]